MKKVCFKKSIIAFLAWMFVICTFMLEAQDVKAIAPEPLDNATVIITNYEIEGAEDIAPGEAFTLNITLQNSSFTEYVGNVYVVYSQADNLVYPEYGSTAMAYAGYFTTQEEKTVSIRLVASDMINVSEVMGRLTVCYSDAYSTSNEIVNTIYFPVSSNGVLGIKSFDLSSSATVNKTNRLGVTYYNSGNADISNIVLHMSGGTLEAQDISFGSLSSGSIETADAYFVFTGEGAQAVDMYFTYVDSKGVSHQTATQTFTFEVSVQDETNTAGMSSNGNLYKVNVVVSLIVLVGSLFAAYILFKFIRKNEKA